MKKLALALALLIVAVLLYAATRPDTLEVTRSLAIKAPPAAIYPLVENFHEWARWSPYDKRDPAMKRTYSGAEQGQGAVYEWSGNSQVGAGRMEIVEASEPSRLGLKLDFLKPFEGHNQADFTFQPQGDETLVTWSMRGPSPYISKLMGLFLNMDQLIGGDFETGLANLKAQAEASPRPSPPR